MCPSTKAAHRFVRLVVRHRFLSLSELTALGWMPVIILLVGVSSTMLTVVLLARSWIRTDAHFGLLTGGAVGICGASASIAMSAVLPQGNDNEQQTLLTSSA